MEMRCLRLEQDSSSETAIAIGTAMGICCLVPEAGLEPAQLQ